MENFVFMWKILYLYAKNSPNGIVTCEISLFRILLLMNVDVDVKFFKSELFSCLPKVDHLIK